MDTKLTLSFDQEVVAKAKKYAAENNISLSKLIERLLIQVTSTDYQSLEEYPIADWVSKVAEGEIEYKTAAKTVRQSGKDEFYEAKK
jgi:hypothetical protein